MQFIPLLTNRLQKFDIILKANIAHRPIKIKLLLINHYKSQKCNVRLQILRHYLNSLPKLQMHRDSNPIPPKKHSITPSPPFT